MKKMFIVLSTLALSIFAQSALAGRSATVKSELTKIVTDDQLGLKPNAGHVIYNSVQNTVSLMINFQGSPCRAGEICIAMMQPPLQVELPVVAFTTGYCGSKILIAEQDLMPVDGTLQKITVSDNTINYCFTDEYIAPVTGEYLVQFVNRENGELVSLIASFEGRPFRTFVK